MPIVVNPLMSLPPLLLLLLFIISYHSMLIKFLVKKYGKNN